MTVLKSLLFAFSIIEPIAYSASITLNPPKNQPDTKPIDHGFVGFGINGVFFPDYAGNNSSPNLYSRNLIETISDRTGAAAVIRVGGTTFDHLLYNASQGKPVKQIAPQDPMGDIEFTLGPSFFESFSALPSVKYIWQVPLAVGSLANSVKLAKLGVKAIGVDQLEALEIGNEPSIVRYGSPEKFIQKWTEYASAISGNISNLPSSPIYQGLGFASEASPPFDIQTMLNQGIDKGKNLKSVSHHFYEVFPGRAGDPPVDDVVQYLEATLLNHEYTVNQTSGFKSAANFLARKYPDVPLVLGEVGSGLPGGDKNDTRRQQIESSLATGVWTADFLLYCMSIGIQQISNQLGPDWLFSPWTTKAPKPGHPSVRPTYFGMVLAADFLGPDTSQPTRVQSLDIPNSDHSLSAYASYQGTELSKIAICNLDLWDSLVSQGSRPEKRISLQLPVGTKSVVVQRLTGPGAFAQGNVTWGGESWTYESDGKAVSVSKNTQTLQVQGGTVNVGVKATEAILVSLRK